MGTLTSGPLLDSDKASLPRQQKSLQHKHTRMENLFILSEPEKICWSVDLCQGLGYVLQGEKLGCPDLDSYSKMFWPKHTH